MKGNSKAFQCLWQYINLVQCLSAGRQQPPAFLFPLTPRTLSAPDNTALLTSELIVGLGHQIFMLCVPHTIYYNCLQTQLTTQIFFMKRTH